MGLALAAASVYWLFTFIGEREMRKLHPLQPSQFPDSFWVTILWVALPLVPFIVSVVLLSTRFSSAAAGIALRKAKPFRNLLWVLIA